MRQPPYSANTVIPDTFDCVRMSIPANDEMIYNLNAALKTLCSPIYYETFDYDPVLWGKIQAQCQAWLTVLSGMTIESDACNLPMIFRRNPDNPVQWDYSNDGGVTWDDGPDTWAYFYPEFTSDLSAPSGYQLSVNYGNNSEIVPQMDQIVDNAVRTNPASTLVNTVSTATGITPLELISGGTVSLLIQSQQKAIDIARKAGFDTSTGEEFLKITKAVADAGDVLVTVLLS